ncbi:NAD(P)H-hydrate dehydratase [Roseibium sp. CAU 1637]|uniref:Bifunctional NAD(P)H-hydrate repair enzyme n=1 Tax=Roseibium limicola TaxID=2816037 RepID=A0A939EMH3_9HYPH|nr:NAD(P)H-hydrate dehydratase [Roseibium limicola]MBO0344567.1 NAD(P)H-hydrate dehydratase [Roseibium limicola]
MTHEILTSEEMAKADLLAIERGVAGLELMECAGKAVADSAAQMCRRDDLILIVCGPGNNGGDGFVAARLLREQGWSVTVLCLKPPAALRGDAASAFASMPGEWQEISALEDFGGALGSAGLVIDALFGAGLDRPLSGLAADIVGAVNAAEVPVLSVDLPSGLNGTTGRVASDDASQGCAIEADATVTFFRKKPGHLLCPGRDLCGTVFLADIGIPEEVLEEIGSGLWENGPGVWLETWKPPSVSGHKYGRGHAVVFSGGATTSGAARLSAMAALRSGAGLVTMASPPSAILVNACHLTAVMLKSIRAPNGGGGEDREESEGGCGVDALLKDERLNAFLLGPGFGVGERARTYVHAILDAGRQLVLDADGLTSFAEDPEDLFTVIRQGHVLSERVGEGEGDTVLTPHDGEFSRLFPRLADLPKLQRVREAALLSGAVVVLKGADTVIAAPDGRAVINSNGSPWLATAGTGDVLAGIICGLLAQRVPAFEAACMAVWLHGAAASSFGPGLIAEDLAGELPAVFRQLLARGPE